MNADYTEALRSLMAAADIPSFRELCRRADVSRWQIRQLRAGRLEGMRVATLLKLSQCLHVSVSALVETFSSAPIGSDRPTVSSQALSGGRGDDESSSSTADLSTAESNTVDPSTTESSKSGKDRVVALQQEYERLKRQVDEQTERAIADFLQSALGVLETWMVQWPTAAYAAENNDTVPAKRLVPLMRPVERLLEHWGVEAIATVGAEIPYDPALHQLMSDTAQPGDPVKVRYVGYRQGEKLLHRAKVSPL
jgi:molecular chaperone GrpE (heat shock protein)/DNA-binding Xre family transcriptional regulator